MDALNGIIEGLGVALAPENLLYLVVGVVVGMVIGVLPGLGPAATIALLLPVTYAMPPDAALIMLAGIYYGAYYGGTITAVLINVPGEAASVVTTFDGHEMAKQGRAGPALGIAAIGSFVGAMVALVGLLTIAPQVAAVAIKMGPPEYAVLAFAGLLLVTLVSPGSFLKGVIAACFGLMIAVVGIDAVSGSARLTFGSADMLGGIHLVAVAMGLFGLGDVLHTLDSGKSGSPITSHVKGVWPNRQDRRAARGPMARGSVIGFVLGLMPGGGGVISAMASYATEKKISRSPERFGKGAIEGVAGPETANNAGTTAAFLPLLTLGIPTNLIFALLYGALLIQGITPGPQLVEDHPEVFWGVIGSMVLGNLMLLALSLPLVGIFVQLVKVRMGILAAMIVVVTVAGIYSVRNSTFDVGVMLAFGIIGYLMRKAGYHPGPLVLAMVLGPLLEVSFRQSMLLSGGDLSIFLTRPVPLVVLSLITVLLVATLGRRFVKGSRDDTDPDDADPTDHQHPPETPAGTTHERESDDRCTSPSR